MSYSVKLTHTFEKNLKRLVKKYPSLKNEYINLIEGLKNQAVQGVHLGKQCYKIRIGIASKGKGKSGGARIITNVVDSQSTVYLLTIYDKSEKDSLKNKELEELLQDLPF